MTCVNLIKDITHQRKLHPESSNNNNNNNNNNDDDDDQENRKF